MKLDQATIKKLAEHLENCELNAKDTPKITDDHQRWIGMMLMRFKMKSSAAK